MTYLDEDDYDYLLDLFGLLHRRNERVTALSYRIKELERRLAQADGLLTWIQSERWLAGTYAGDAVEEYLAGSPLKKRVEGSSV